MVTLADGGRGDASKTADTVRRAMEAADQLARDLLRDVRLSKTASV